LGRRFEKEVRQISRKIQDAPQAASFAYDTVRYKVMDKFPFIILYEQQDKYITILRVFNTHKDIEAL